MLAVVSDLAVRDRRVRRALDLIASQPSRSVRELALEVRLSPAHLQRLFKQELGVHIRDVMMEHRLQWAVHLLSTTDLSIKEISYSAGYEHHSSFVRAFQRRFTQAPRRYRQYNDCVGDVTSFSAKCAIGAQYQLSQPAK